MEKKLNLIIFTALLVSVSSTTSIQAQTQNLIDTLSSGPVSNTKAKQFSALQKRNTKKSLTSEKKKETRTVIGTAPPEIESDNNKKLATLSRIEKIFNTDPNQPIIYQFGYNLFQRSSYHPNQTTVSGSYVLRPGDSVVVYTWGDAVDYASLTGKETLEPLIETNVDREGNIFVPGSGVIRAQGRAVVEVEASIRQLMTSKYENINVKLSVLEPGNYNVMVMGKVRNPGKVYINNTTTFIDAISLAGGILKTGSLREIEIIDSFTKEKTTIDLYDLLIHGDYQDIPLNEGDVILIKPINNTMGVANGVLTPAIYELMDHETIEDVISFSGGLLPDTNLDEANLERYNKQSNEKETISSTPSSLERMIPQSGDLLSFKKAFQSSTNIVALSGNVKHPGTFEYKQGMKLSDIIPSSTEIMARTFLSQAIITRFTGKGKELNTIPVSLSEFFNGLVDPNLQPMDKIEVFSITQLPTIEIAGEVSNPGILPYRKNLTLNDIISTISFDTNPNDLVVEITNPNKVLIEVSEEQTVDDIKSPDITSESEDIEDVMTQQKSISKVVKEKREEKIYLYDLLTQNVEENNVKILPNDKLLFRPLINKETLKTIKVFGYVNSPGIFKIQPGMKVSDAIKLAGGINPKGYLKGIVFLRPSVGKAQKDALALSILQTQEEIALKAGAAQAFSAEGSGNDILSFIKYQKDLLDIMKEKLNQKYGRIIIKADGNNVSTLSANDDFEIIDGDQIIIPPYPTEVSIIGEVYNQSAIAHTPTRTVENYINEVGGLTKNADKKGVYIIKTDGSVQKLKKASITTLEPGDSVIIPRKIKYPINIRGIIKDITSIGANAASTVFVLTKI